MYKIISENKEILIILMIFIILLGLVILLLPLFQKNKKEPQKIKEIIDEELTKEIFELYKKTEVAKSKFDYNTLKELLDDKLYEEEEKKLKELQNKKQKLVATNIKLQALKILSNQKKDNSSVISAYLHVSEYNYIIDSKKKIKRGTDEAEYQIEYRITIEKTNDNLKIKKQECTGKWIINK